MSRTATLTGQDLEVLLKRLTGQALPLPDEMQVLDQVAASITAGQSLGYSQFNELLLSVGYDRVSQEFFLYLCDPKAVCASGDGEHEISSADGLREGIRAFRELSLLAYGNVKFGFKHLSMNPDLLDELIELARRERPDTDFRSRHEPLVPLKPIEARDAHLLGYISGAEVDKLAALHPTDPAAAAAKRRKDELVELGRWNQSAYLMFDHLDVYVATSMRAQHEFVFVKEFIKKLEIDAHIKDLKLRFFDPTAAYCSDRIDKGLAEALMLKRAACTIYLAQESETLGKDSELASTLAQGKPVIAFVPRSSERFWEYVKRTFSDVYSVQGEDLYLQLLRIYSQGAAWEDQELIGHISKTAPVADARLEEKAREAVIRHYDKKADTLMNTHPLGLQTNLNSGVANGVLVVRRIETCAQLLKQIILNKMQFDVQDQEGHVVLREKISTCVYRVMTGDQLLSNSFWNFYNR